MDTLPPVSLIDSVVFGEHDWISMSHDEQQALRLRLLREAFALHVASSDAYRSFVERRQVSPEDFRTPADLTLIPQFPTSVFKRQQLLSVPTEEIVASFLSSGTSGTRSVIYRDSLTLHRLCGMMRTDSPLFGTLLDGMDETNSVILNLGTSRNESQHVWFGYVMSLLEQVAPMHTYTSTDRTDLAGAVEDTRRYLTEKERLFVVGPPFLVADYCAAIRESGVPVRGGGSVLVFTGGGWKNRDRERIDGHEFHALVSSALGLDNATQIRDVFNQVELNTLLVECEHHNKHIPPWVHAFARDPATFVPLPDGETGVLSFSDASAHSYPCFFVGDDLGQVISSECACGRPGLRLRISSRLRGASHAGCAETMQTGRGYPSNGNANDGQRPPATES